MGPELSGVKININHMDYHYQIIICECVLLLSRLLAVATQ